MKKHASSARKSVSAQLGNKGFTRPTRAVGNVSVHDTGAHAVPGRQVAACGLESAPFAASGNLQLPRSLRRFVPLVRQLERLHSSS